MTETKVTTFATQKFFMPVKGASTKCFRPGDALDGDALDFAVRNGFASAPPARAAAPAPAVAAKDEPAADGASADAPPPATDARPRRRG